MSYLLWWTTDSPQKQLRSFCSFLYSVCYSWDSIEINGKWFARRNLVYFKRMSKATLLREWCWRDKVDYFPMAGSSGGEMLSLKMWMRQTIKINMIPICMACPSRLIGPKNPIQDSKAFFSVYWIVSARFLHPITSDCFECLHPVYSQQHWQVWFSGFIKILAGCQLFLSSHRSFCRNGWLYSDVAFFSSLVFFISPCWFCCYVYREKKGETNSHTSNSSGWFFHMFCWNACSMVMTSYCQLWEWWQLQ